MLKQRLLTALVLIPLVLAAIFWLELKWFALVFAIIITLGAWEWGGLCGLKKISSLLYCLAIISVLAVLFYINNEKFNLLIIFTANIFWLYAFIAIIFFQSNKNILPASTLMMTLIGMILLIPT